MAKAIIGCVLFLGLIEVENDESLPTTNTRWGKWTLRDCEKV